MIEHRLKPNPVQRGLDCPGPLQVHTQQQRAPVRLSHGVKKSVGISYVCRVNPPTFGPEGDIRLGGQANGYDNAAHHSTGPFTSVLADPPCTVNGIDTERSPHAAGFDHCFTSK